ncbi:MAG: hypothetical protein LM582_08510 [Desulfurococcaceae archaeon]|nr:hypothetical protein [Desulfurococcaceae archaeon]
MLNDFYVKGWNRFIDCFAKIKISGKDIPRLYESKDFDKIISYIIEEFEITLKAINNVLGVLRPLSMHWDKKCKVVCEGV